MQEGLWSKPEDTIALYTKIYNGVAPYVRQNVPEDVTKSVKKMNSKLLINQVDIATNKRKIGSKLVFINFQLPVVPSFVTMTNCAKGMWNRGVMTSIKFTSELPTHLSNGIDYVMSTPAINQSVSSVKGLFAEQPETGKSQ